MRGFQDFEKQNFRVYAGVKFIFLEEYKNIISLYRL